MGRGSSASLVILAIAFLPTPGHAQSLWCLRGAPAPECRGVLRIEVRGGGAMQEDIRYHTTRTPDSTGTSERVDETPWVDVGDWIGVEVGYLRNVDPRWGVGASAAVETGNETTRVLVRGQARRWAGRRIYVEGLAGGSWQRRDLLYRSGDGLRDGVGLNAEARVGYAGWGFGLARLDVLHLARAEATLGTSGRTQVDPGGTVHALSVGAGLEGPAALLAGALTLLVGGLVFLVAGGPIA